MISVPLESTRGLLLAHMLQHGARLIEIEGRHYVQLTIEAYNAAVAAAHKAEASFGHN